jgi:cytidylate kinase
VPRVIIAIDGPAGSGKSSTAKAVAKQLGFRHLDSGAFYRAITLAALQRAIPVEAWSNLDVATLNALQVTAEPVGGGLVFRVAGEDVTNEIRSPEVNAHVSQMAAVPAVRDWLLGQLRAVGEATNVVSDGRDIGTVVFPDADLKIFLIAQSDVRARRRLAENGKAAPTALDVQKEVDRLAKRDKMDSQREVAPLKQADDAIIIDTTAIGFDEQVARIVTLGRDIMKQRAREAAE